MHEDELLNSTPHLVKTRVGDAEYLKDKLRKEDVAEIKASSGSDPFEVLTIGALFSDYAFTALSRDGKPIGMMGLNIHVEGQMGYIWAVFTPEIKRHSKLLMQITPNVLALFNTRCPLLVNKVDTRNSMHIKWLRALGFTFYSETTGADPSVTFLNFARINHV